MALYKKYLGIVIIGIIIIVLVTFLIPTETFGAEPNPTGNPVGGGKGYTGIISERDNGVKYIVSTKDQLIGALNNAQSGEIIFVKGDSVIDLTDTYQLTIPAGVTLASDRGLDGSPGALLKRPRGSPITAYSQIFTFVARGDNVRVTGLRFNGENAPQDDTTVPQEKYLIGIWFENCTGSVIDNCEFWGWSQAGIAQDNGTSYIHHNYIHHNQARGEGYGFVIGGGNTIVEANLFDYNRHDIAAAGFPGEGYEARYNIVLGNGTAIGGHHFDVHAYPGDPETIDSIAGYEYKIHHNTFESTDLICIGIRALPEKGVWIDHNIFLTGYNTPPVFQRYAGPFGRVNMTRNYIGKSGSPPVLVEGEDIQYLRPDNEQSQQISVSRD
jgi:hypothetical protein